MSANHFVYLAVDDLVCGSYFDIPVAWVGEDGDAVAITADRRRGLAAIHAHARHDLGGPARIVGEVETLLVRFRERSDSDSWELVASAPGDAGAMPAIVVHEVDLVSCSCLGVWCR
ncbi:hypothetical protein [Amycolatopsis regifaucium]|uniref:Uncharacterized protein n=1 Tax=Amycolatopsis regifaucium TaxID=546365 RepID=A0A154M7E2_9PSEU|nr:hypothetical protein [Amycolatopsis regifaucium]KZB80502.1 hypothetical protein AVL48_37925 [Amycolatopsis regifaucium]OKA03047.1 hypothetical protein ATP06_0238235 [Amycolatopsis regifaucium]SFJ76334.1 hypothetical protein SAMN04489731_1473 [Amycolatopsis regifaucium]